MEVNKERSRRKEGERNARGDGAIVVETARVVVVPENE